MIVSETIPPPQIAGVDEWERGLDPWHIDAAPVEVADAPFWKQGPRQAGWYALDWVKNVIGFVPDGTEYPDAQDA